MEADLEDHEKRHGVKSMVDRELLDGSILSALWRSEGNELRPIKRVSSNNSSRASMAQRNNLVEYFITEIDSLPWQEDQVLRGSVPDIFVSI